MENKAWVILLFLIIIGSIYLKLTMIERDFWHDEAFQYLYSKESVGFILEANDVHPPLFNLLTKGLLTFVSDDIRVLRGIMLFVSIFFLLGFITLVKDLFNRWIAIYSGILLSLAPTYLYYSTEFRNYMFVLLLAVWQITYFNRYLEEQNTKNFLMFILLSLAMVYSHYLAGLLIVAQVLYVFFLGEFRDRYGLFLPVVAGAVPLMGYLIVSLFKIQSFWFKDIDIISFISTFNYLMVWPTDHIFGYTAGILLIIVAGLFFFKKDRLVGQFSLYVIVPIVIMWCISQTIPFYHHRYFLFGGIGLFVLAGWSIYNFQKKLWWSDVAIITSYLVLVGISAPILIDSLDTTIKDSVVFLDDYASPGYNTIHSSTFSQSPYKVYLPENNHYLVSNLTEKQLFTAGGSVVQAHERLARFEDAPPGELYFVSDHPGNGEVIYDREGIFITKLQ